MSSAMVRIVTFAALLWLSYGQIEMNEEIGDETFKLQTFVSDLEDKISNCEADNAYLLTHSLVQDLKIKSLEERIKALLASQKESTSIVPLPQTNHCDGNPCPEGTECHSSGAFYDCRFKNSDDIMCQWVGEMGCLTLVRVRMNWEYANKECSSRGMRLLEDIPDRQHFRDIWMAFHITEWMWIGGKQRRWRSSNKGISSDLYFNGCPNGRMEECLSLFVFSVDTGREGIDDDECIGTFFPLCQAVLG